MRSRIASLALLLTAACGGQPLPPLSGEPAARIELFRPRRNLFFELDEEGWVAARSGRKARAERVEKLLAGLRALRSGPAVAPAERGDAFGLGPADAVRVRVSARTGETLFDAEFGRRTAGLAGYARTGPGAAVRLAEGVDAEELRAPEEDWLEPERGFRRPSP